MYRYRAGVDLIDLQHANKHFRIYQCPEPHTAMFTYFDEFVVSTFKKHAEECKLSHQCQGKCSDKYKICLGANSVSKKLRYKELTHKSDFWRKATIGCF